MTNFFRQRKNCAFRKLMSFSVAMLFCFNISGASAQLLLQSAEMLSLSPVFAPPVLKGMSIHAENPLLFDFVVDRGQDRIDSEKFKVESEKLVKYFLASLTIPDRDSWVNLSPYEKDRIIPEALSQTEMGRTMLEQDYILKQLAAALTNPDKDLGRKFWAEVEARAKKQFNTFDVPLSTFNKVWIVPNGAEVFEKDGFVYITASKLKVMLEEDYVAMGKNTVGAGSQPARAGYEPAPTNVNTVSTAVFREMILPQLEKEINSGKNFAPVRQVYHSVILATWYKKALKDSLLGRVYADQSKIKGIESNDKNIREKVYAQYLAAFKKGAYSIIKENENPEGEMIPRKYFSGGITSLGQTKISSSSAAMMMQDVAQAGSRLQLMNVVGEEQASASVVVKESGVANPLAASSASKSRPDPGPFHVNHIEKVMTYMMQMKALLGERPLGLMDSPTISRNSGVPLEHVTTILGRLVKEKTGITRGSGHDYFVSNDYYISDIDQVLAGLNGWKSKIVDWPFYAEKKITELKSRTGAIKRILSLFESGQREDDYLNYLARLESIVNQMPQQPKLSTYQTLDEWLRITKQLQTDVEMFWTKGWTPAPLYFTTRRGEHRTFGKLYRNGDDENLYQDKQNLSVHGGISLAEMMEQYSLPKIFRNTPVEDESSEEAEEAEKEDFAKDYGLSLGPSLPPSPSLSNIDALGEYLDAIHVVKNLFAQTLSDDRNFEYEDAVRVIDKVLAEKTARDNGWISHDGRLREIPAKFRYETGLFLVMAKIQLEKNFGQVENIIWEMYDELAKKNDNPQQVAVLTFIATLAYAGDQAAAIRYATTLLHRLWGDKNSMDILALAVTAGLGPAEGFGIPYMARIFREIEQEKKGLDLNVIIGLTIAAALVDRFDGPFGNMTTVNLVKSIYDRFDYYEPETRAVLTIATIIEAHVPKGGSVSSPARPPVKGDERASTSTTINLPPATPGGIDFDPTLLNLQIKRDGRGVPLPLPQQNIEQINIEGLYPVIINIQPFLLHAIPALSDLKPEPSTILSKG